MNNDTETTAISKLLDDAEENIIGLETLREPEEIRYRPISLARQDVVEAKALIDKNSKASAERDKRLADGFSKAFELAETLNRHIYMGYHHDKLHNESERLRNKLAELRGSLQGGGEE